MKPALRYIPTEVWVDIFCFPWISREELGQLVDKIGNHKFAEFLQFYLHEWGKRTLDDLYLSESTLPDIPQTPIPENIKFFKNITIWHSIIIVRVDIVRHGIKYVRGELENIVKHAAGRILRENVEMKFQKNNVFGHGNVTVSEMADEALVHSGLAKEGYECHRVALRKGIEFVEANGNSPIQHGALYTVAVVRKERMIAQC